MQQAIIKQQLDQVTQEETGISKGRAARLAAKITGAKKRDIYKKALKKNEIR